MTTRHPTDLDLSGPSIFLSRVIEAPQELVWRAWTDPTMLAEWWGPRGITNRCEVDLRVGGRFHIVMRLPTGGEHPIDGTFLEVEPITRLVLRLHAGKEHTPVHDALNAARGQPPGTPLPEPIWVVRLEGAGSRTTLRLENRFDSIENRDGHVKTGVYEGWSQSFERLEELLENRQ